MSGKGYFERLGARRMAREGAGLPAPKTGVRRYFYLLGCHFGKFVVLNLLLVACTVPVVTLPAGISAANRVCIRLIRDGNCFLWSDFFEEFRKSFVQSLPLGLLFGAGLAAAYYLMSLGVSNNGSAAGLVFLAAGLFLGCFTLLRGGWTFVLLSMLPLKNRALLHNARILSLKKGGRSAGILFAELTAVAAGALLFPVSIPLLALLLLSLVQYTVCFLVNSAVQELIFDPYEKQQQEATPYGATDGTLFGP